MSNRILMMIGLAGSSILAHAATVPDKDLPVTAMPETTINARMQSLDSNHDGMVSVYEIRAFIEARHGKTYEKQVLDDLESSASGKSCSSPFTKSRF